MATKLSKPFAQNNQVQFQHKLRPVKRDKNKEINNQKILTKDYDGIISVTARIKSLISKIISLISIFCNIDIFSMHYRYNITVNNKCFSSPISNPCYDALGHWQLNFGLIVYNTSFIPLSFISCFYLANTNTIAKEKNQRRVKWQNKNINIQMIKI